MHKKQVKPLSFTCILFFWTYLNPFCLIQALEPEAGLEPATYALRMRRSTN